MERGKSKVRSSQVAVRHSMGLCMRYVLSEAYNGIPVGLNVFDAIFSCSIGAISVLYQYYIYYFDTTLIRVKYGSSTGQPVFLIVFAMKEVSINVWFVVCC